MGIDSKERQSFWPIVTAFGALWGAMEVTLGSFLHTLRLPFSGVFLATVGAMLLVAQRQILPRRGISVATAIVAAMCKSISPGGIILGPMIGIATEGLLVEIALLLRQRGIVSVALAGALCAMWAAFQQIITQYVYYGKPIIELYLVALAKAGSWLGISGNTGWWVLATLIGIVTCIGASGGIIGRKLGKDSSLNLLKMRKEQVTRFFENTKGENLWTR